MIPLNETWIQAKTRGLHLRLRSDTNVSGLIVGGFGGPWNYGDVTWDVIITDTVYNNHKQDFDAIDVKPNDRLMARYISQRPANGPSDWVKFIVGRRDSEGNYSEKDYLNDE